MPRLRPGWIWPARNRATMFLERSPTPARALIRRVVFALPPCAIWRFSIASSRQESMPLRPPQRTAPAGRQVACLFLPRTTGVRLTDQPRGMTSSDSPRNVRRKGDALNDVALVKRSPGRRDARRPRRGAREVWGTLRRCVFRCRADAQEGRLATRWSVPQHFAGQGRRLRLGYRHANTTPQFFVDRACLSGDGQLMGS